MKLTRSVSYAVSIVLRVERDGAGSPMTAAQISRGCRFPPRFLYRVLRRLVDAGVLTGVSGPHGGYALAMPAQRIRLRDIVLALEDPSESASLVPAHPGHAGAIKFINALSEQNSRAFEKKLAGVSLAKLARIPAPAKRQRAAKKTSAPAVKQTARLKQPKG
jgi:Rrf2 family iron-sulfur cluster assembly transcriptional regulator